MLVKNIKKRGRPVVTGSGVIQFDENGIADITDKTLLKNITSLKGFSLVSDTAEGENADGGDSGIKDDLENKKRIRK